MRASVAVLAFVAAASASVFERQSIPSCAMQCMASADYGSCQPTDNACLCKSDTFVNSTYACIASTCKGNDLENAIAGARALCAASGVTLTQSIPASTAAPTATSPAGSSSGSASATASSTAAPSSSPNSASTLGVSGLGALAAVAGVVFAL
ncbi:CFEM domain protein [Ceratobasidium sp. AG-Ba]|nr:CFEM domain protein [Ceratobasidium sp. AG-Ba]QRW13562.1 CFEM domain protein [Ceratobasidium sp. AG-Ba]